MHRSGLQHLEYCDGLPCVMHQRSSSPSDVLADILSGCHQSSRLNSSCKPQQVAAAAAVQQLQQNSALPSVDSCVGAQHLVSGALGHDHNQATGICPQRLFAVCM